MATEDQYRVIDSPNARVLVVRPEVADAVGRLLRDKSYVESIEPDALVYLGIPSAEPDGVTEPRAVASQARVLATQSVAVPWGLDRIDQASPVLDGLYHYDNTGEGVDVFVMDTGIFAQHADLLGKVFPDLGRNFVPGLPVFSTGDCVGHGTHVSGTIAGTRSGVAKDVRLIPLRVFGCYDNTETSVILDAMAFLTARAVADNATPGGRRKVVNMSFGSSRSTAMNSAVQALVAAGVTVVISAGNSYYDACGYSPASAAGGFTVGASDVLDVLADFSNFGPCVHVYAPGVNVLSSIIDSPTAYDFNSGTSMAAPHTTGTAALILQLLPELTPAEVKRAVICLSARDRLNPFYSSQSITVNRLLQAPLAPHDASFLKACIPNVVCPFNCSNIGTCRLDELCSCPCGYASQFCNERLTIRSLPHVPSVTVTLSNEEEPNNFGDPSGDLYFRFDANGHEDIVVSTCNPGTTIYYTNLVVVRECFRGPYVLLSELGVVASSTFYNNPYPGSYFCSLVTLRQLAHGTYYLFVEGYYSSVGIVELSVTRNQTEPQVNPLTTSNAGPGGAASLLSLATIAVTTMVVVAFG